MSPRLPCASMAVRRSWSSRQPCSKAMKASSTFPNALQTVRTCQLLLMKFLPIAQPPPNFPVVSPVARHWPMFLLPFSEIAALPGFSTGTFSIVYGPDGITGRDFQFQSCRHKLFKLFLLLQQTENGPFRNVCQKQSGYRFFQLFQCMYQSGTDKRFIH